MINRILIRSIYSFLVVSVLSGSLSAQSLHVTIWPGKQGQPSGQPGQLPHTDPGYQPPKLPPPPPPIPQHSSPFNSDGLQKRIETDFEQLKKIDVQSDLDRQISYQALVTAHESLRRNPIVSSEGLRTFQRALASPGLEPIELNPAYLQNQIEQTNEQIDRFDSPAYQRAHDITPAQYEARDAAEFYNIAAEEALAQSDPLSARESVHWARTAISIALDIMPVAGSIKGAIEFAIGYDIVTFEKLSATERALAAASIVPWGGVLKGGKALIKGISKSLRHAATTAKGSRVISRMAARYGHNVSESTIRGIGPMDEVGEQVLESVGKHASSPTSAVKSYSAKAVQQVQTKLQSGSGLSRMKSAARGVENVVGSQGAQRWMEATDPIASAKVLDDLGASGLRGVGDGIQRLSANAGEGVGEAYLRRASDVSSDLMGSQSKSKLLVVVDDPVLAKRILDAGSEVTPATLRSGAASRNLNDIIAKAEPRRFRFASSVDDFGEEFGSAMRQDDRVTVLEIGARSDAGAAKGFQLSPGTRNLTTPVGEVTDEFIARAIRQAPEGAGLKQFSRAGGELVDEGAVRIGNLADESLVIRNTQFLRRSPESLARAADDLGIEAKTLAAREDRAIRFFSQMDGVAENPGQISNYMKGIDYADDVTEVTLRKGDKVVQWQFLMRNGDGSYSLTRKGHFFSPDATMTPARLGIDDLRKLEGETGQVYSSRFPVRYRATEDTPMLQTKTADTYDNWSRRDTLVHTEIDIRKADRIDADLGDRFTDLMTRHEDSVLRGADALNPVEMKELQRLQGELSEFGFLARGHYAPGGGTQLIGDPKKFEMIE